MISEQEYLKGRDKSDPLDEDQIKNMNDLISKINIIRNHYAKPMTVSSGYRPASINKSVGGAKSSKHLTCQAIDISDPNKEFQAWVIENVALFEQQDLYIEDFSSTPTWVHIQSVPPKSKSRFFKP